MAAMRPRSRLSFLLAVVVALLGLVLSPFYLPAIADVREGQEKVAKSEIPQKARDVLREIQGRNGEPPPGYVGGRRFENRERRVPKGTYREYDVNPKIRNKDRGSERIVIEQNSGKAYYTADHYKTFTLMN